MCIIITSRVSFRYEKKIADYIDMGEYVKAFRVFDEYLNGDFYH